MENNSIISGDKPTVMVTNDDGIEGPGLLALVQVLVSTRRYNVLVCAPDTYLLKNHQTLKIFFTLPNSFESLFIDRKKIFISTCREQSAVSHCITWRHPIAAKQVHIDGATAYAVSGMEITKPHKHFSHFMTKWSPPLAPKTQKMNK